MSCCFELTGKPACREKSRVTQPSLPVAVCGGIDTWLYGTAVAYTCAPCTGWPHVLLTWTRSVNPVIL